MCKLIFRYLFFVLFIFFTSCSSRQYQTLFERKNNIADTTSLKNATGIEQYQIKPQDILQIRNLQNINYIVDETPLRPNTSGGASGGQGQTYRVEEDGTVALPFIDHIKVVGLTRIDAQNLIEGIYRKTVFKDPIIELKIVNLKVTVLGEIKGQGNYPLIKDKTTLVELIGEAGGLTDKANEKNIKIIRGTELNPQVTEVNLDNLQSINDPKSILQSGDIIYISQSKRAARNDNLQNFSVVFQSALIVLNTALIIFALIHK